MTENHSFKSAEESAQVFGNLPVVSSSYKWPARPTALGPKAKRLQPSKAAKARVMAAFDPAKLIDICERDNFDDYAPYFALRPGGAAGLRDRFYHYKNNGSKILGIAHLDSVQDDGTCTITNTAAGQLVVSGTLDDRLGAYVILEMLPKLGITCDWLLTTDEEIGQSTAGDFDLGEHTDKTYNWMFQFDRGGTDVVMYDYETAELATRVEDSGARVGSGSFSDICQLEHLGCAGLNWGVGYQDYHGPRSHAWLDDTFRMVARFEKFYKANSGIFMPYEPKRYAKYGALSEKWGAWDDPDDAEVVGAADMLIVADCGHEVNLDDVRTFVEESKIIVCKECGTDSSIIIDLLS